MIKLFKQMPLVACAKLGPYEINAPLGAGGMGEVHRAKDTRLGREVAIKILSGEFSSNMDRMDRLVPPPPSLFRMR